MNALTRIELAYLCGCLSADICTNYRDRHVSALARSWVRTYIPLLRKLRTLTKEAA